MYSDLYLPVCKNRPIANKISQLSAELLTPVGLQAYSTRWAEVVLREHCKHRFDGAGWSIYQTDAASTTPQLGEYARDCARRLHRRHIRKLHVEHSIGEVLVAWFSLPFVPFVSLPFVQTLLRHCISPQSTAFHRLSLLVLLLRSGHPSGKGRAPLPEHARRFSYISRVAAGAVEGWR